MRCLSLVTGLTRKCLYAAARCQLCCPWRRLQSPTPHTDRQGQLLPPGVARLPDCRAGLLPQQRCRDGETNSLSRHFTHYVIVRCMGHSFRDTKNWKISSLKLAGRISLSELLYRYVFIFISKFWN